MASVDELACTYAALILADDDVAITADKLSTILKAAKVEVEPVWPTLFARALSSVDIRSVISNIGSATGSAPAAAAAGGGAAPAEEKKEEKKEESEEESDDDMGFGLFD